MLRRSSRAGLAIALVVSLAACVETTRLPAAEPSPSVAPLFASDEEALAAATEAYEAFLAALDVLLQAPRPVDDELDRVADGQALDSARESVLEFHTDGLRLSSPRVLARSELQQVIADVSKTTVVGYFCEDITGVQLLDSEGNSLTDDDRPGYTVFEATVVFGQGHGLVSERLFWSIETEC